MKQIIERFNGEHGKRLLIEALRTQKLVAGREQLAEELSGLVELQTIKIDETLIHQDDSDNDIYFILAGSFSILVNGQYVAKRGAADHVGEMAAIDPVRRRSATVVAAEESVVGKLSEPQLAELAQRYPDIWRMLAKELAERLDQRRHFVTPKREKSKLFIISSVEALEIAREIQDNFDHDDITVTVWTDGVFTASNYSIESLEKVVNDSDFAIAIAQPDDITISRGKDKSVARDNVIFELGLFIGRLGRMRTLLLEPRNEEVDLPSDLRGLTPIGYRWDKSAPAASMGSPCNQVRKVIKELGPRE
jgi:CRP/FNR family transcriptional regulator, cyclic AMP receptor protein